MQVTLIRNNYLEKSGSCQLTEMYLELTENSFCQCFSNFYCHCFLEILNKFMFWTLCTIKLSTPIMTSGLPKFQSKELTWRIYFEALTDISPRKCEEKQVRKKTFFWTVHLAHLGTFWTSGKCFSLLTGEFEEKMGTTLMPACNSSWLEPAKIGTGSAGNPGSMKSLSKK